MLSERQRSLEEKRRQETGRVVQRILGLCGSRISILEPITLGRHPLASVIYRLSTREGPSSRDLIARAIEALGARSHKDTRRILEGRLIALQSTLVLPDSETRGAILRPDSVDEAELEGLLDYQSALMSPAMPPWWSEFVSISASYTVVTVNDLPAPSRFSGTYSDAASAIHGSLPVDPELYVETLTHESGHLWLNLVSDSDSQFIKNSYAEQIFVSPWRGDARPIHGILHGAYVFTAVILALSCLGTDTAQIRAAQLYAQVADAIRQVMTFGLLSTDADEIVRRIDVCLQAVEPSLKIDALTAARSNYAIEKERKVQRLSLLTPGLRVA